MIVPYVVQHRGRAEGDDRPVRRPDRRVAARPRPVVHVRPAPVRSRRPHRGGCRRGRWHLDLDGSHFARPLRLSRSEALALYLRGTELLGDGGHAGRAGARRRRSTSCETALGTETLGDAERVEMAESTARRWRRSSPSVRRPRTPTRRRSSTSRIRRASGARAGSTRRRCSSALGQWYVAAWDVIGRRRAAVPRGSDPSGGADRRGVRSDGASRAPADPLYTPTEEDVAVRLRLAPGGAMDRRVLRDHGRAGTSRRIARDHAAREVRWAGWRGCCCGSGATRPSWSHPN